MYIQKLLTEIVKRGCCIEVNNYPIDDLTSIPKQNNNTNGYLDHFPKCLVKINDHLVYDNGYNQTVACIKMSSLIPNNVNIYFTIHGDHGEPRVVIWEKVGHCVYWFRNEKDFSQLDFLTHYLYTNGGKEPDLFISCKNPTQPTQEDMDYYRGYLKDKMIQDLVKQGVLYILVFKTLPLELKLLIMDKVMRLDHWYNLGIMIHQFNI